MGRTFVSPLKRVDCVDILVLGAAFVLTYRLLNSESVPYSSSARQLYPDETAQPRLHYLGSLGEYKVLWLRSELGSVTAGSAPPQPVPGHGVWSHTNQTVFAAWRQPEI